MAESFMTGNKAQDLNYTYPVRFLNPNLLTAAQMSHLTFCCPQPRYYLVQVLAAVIRTAAAAAICSVTLLDFASCSPAHTWLRILLLGCRMCHIAAVMRMQRNRVVMSSGQCCLFSTSMSVSSHCVCVCVCVSESMFVLHLFFFSPFGV